MPISAIVAFHWAALSGDEAGTQDYFCQLVPVGRRPQAVGDGDDEGEGELEGFGEGDVEDLGDFEGLGEDELEDGDDCAGWTWGDTLVEG